MLNRVVLIGRVVKKRELEGNGAVDWIRIDLAINKRIRDKEYTTFLTITFFIKRQYL